MNITRSIAGLFTVLLFSGCASFNTPMKNADGNVIECRNSGWGWLGAPAAYVMQRKCESEFRERGYIAFSDVAPPSVTKNAAKTESPDGQAAAAPGRDSAEIERLHAMHKAGALTPEEFALAKQRLLSR